MSIQENTTSIFFPYTNQDQKYLISILLNLREEIKKAKQKKKSIFKSEKLPDSRLFLSTQNSFHQGGLSQFNPAINVNGTPASGFQPSRMTVANFKQFAVGPYAPAVHLKTTPMASKLNHRWLKHLFGTNTAEFEPFGYMKNWFDEQTFLDVEDTYQIPKANTYVIPPVSDGRYNGFQGNNEYQIVESQSVPMPYSVNTNTTWNSITSFPFGRKYWEDCNFTNMVGQSSTVSFLDQQQQKKEYFCVSCSFQYQWLAQLLSKGANNLNAEIMKAFKFHRLHPELFQLLFLIHTPFSISPIASFNFQPDSVLKKVYSTVMTQQESERLAYQLNKLMVDFLFSVSSDALKKEVLEFERLPKINKQTIEDYVKEIYRVYPDTVAFRLKLFTYEKRADDLTDNDFYVNSPPPLIFKQSNHAISIPQSVIKLRKDLIKKIQNWEKFNLIRGYLWRLDYEAGVGYSYILDCLVDQNLLNQTENKRDVQEHIGRLWLDCLPKLKYPGYPGYLINDIVGLGTIRMPFISKEQKKNIRSENCKKVTTVLAAQFDIALCVHIDTRSQRKIAFGKKSIKSSKG